MSSNIEESDSYKEKEQFWNSIYKVVGKSYQDYMEIESIGGGLLYFALDFLYRNASSEEEADLILKSVVDGVKEIGEFSTDSKGKLMYRELLQRDYPRSMDKDDIAKA